MIILDGRLCSGKFSGKGNLIIFKIASTEIWASPSAVDERKIEKKKKKKSTSLAEIRA